MPEAVKLSDSNVREVHAFLAGYPTELAKIIDKSSVQKTEWLVPVNSATVFSIVTLYLLATDHRIAIRLQPAVGLSLQENIFHQDFLQRGLPASQSFSRKFHFFWHENLALLADGLITLRYFHALFRHAVAIEPHGFRTALLIGQYGGEHVGDAAILGGVLSRAYEQFGVREAHVLSHRPEHTQRLADGLETPVDVFVHPSDHRQILSLLDRIDGLIFAGGPMMDLPRILARQLAVSLAVTARAKPIVIDRVGIGPFRRRVSRMTVRTILRQASEVSVRTQGAALDPVVADLCPEIVHDPAFDYLATRDHLDRLPERDRMEVDRILQGTDDGLRIGVNLRPIRLRWSVKGEVWSKAMAEQFLKRFAQALVRYARQSDTRINYVFFCMNPQEFGMSDLRIAYQLHRQLGGEVDYRVWQGDPDVDGVLYLLRRLDGAIAMRFHACIFALTQNLPTLGIDYRPGTGGKVEQLFADRQKNEDVRRMDLFEEDWLVNALVRLTPELKRRKKARTTG